MQLNLKSKRTKEEILARGDEPLSVRAPLTRRGWEMIAAASDGDPVTVLSLDGWEFTGTVIDIDEERYAFWIELA